MVSLPRSLQSFTTADVPLDDRTTFRVGGSAAWLAEPRTVDQLRAALAFARDAGLPLFRLGGGSNIVVADAGVPGLTVSLRYCAPSEADVDGPTIVAGGRGVRVAAGRPMSEAAAYAADHDLAGLEFIYAMPGTVGGAVWMNARCYGSSIVDVLTTVDYLDAHLQCRTAEIDPAAWDYKMSPFQDGVSTILAATFHLAAGASRASWQQMRAHEADRRAKGHFSRPCAGSVFKNDRRFGAPSGTLIDRLGLKGLSRGGATVSEDHANIIVNSGNATAADIRSLVSEVRRRVFDAYGFLLEPEILFVGSWPADDLSVDRLRTD